MMLLSGKERLQWCFSKLRSNLIPDRCALCGSGEPYGTICYRCLAALPVADAACQRCAVPLAAAQAAATDCGPCQAKPPVFTRAFSAVNYAFPIDAALKAFKFHGRLYYAPAFASLLLPLLNSGFIDADALVPVPLHRWRHARRGFNQATEICRILAGQSGIPMYRPVSRIRPTRSQSGLTAAARHSNLKNAFMVCETLRCRHPVIIDDVMTTGETCNQIARVLIGAGAESVGVLVIARA
ncbi:MAG: ComF family protein [Gammaproteobacteria bacterium]|nr:ComF family protein [Gammaproteobacteria bacterium]